MARKTLRNAYMLVIIGVDTAKNGPRKGSKKTDHRKDPARDTEPWEFFQWLAPTATEASE